ncbi:MAG: response regulator [Methanotrichaceae archaeon]|nr:response regulator [Methanotrichaceae archaeon]
MTQKRILVVEDEGIVAMDIRNRLRHLGYEVSAIASSGEEAIKRAKEGPQLILMDIVLKGKMDGIEAASRIRERLNIPIIFLSGQSDDNTMQRVKLAGSRAHIIKPFDDLELQNVIKAALDVDEVT